MTAAVSLQCCALLTGRFIQTVASLIPYVVKRGMQLQTRPLQGGPAARARKATRVLLERGSNSRRPAGINANLMSKAANATPL